MFLAIFSTININKSAIIIQTANTELLQVNFLKFTTKTDGESTQTICSRL